MNAKVRLLVVVFSKICVYFQVPSVVMCALSRSVIVFQLFHWQICIYGKITLLFLFLDYFGLIRSIISTLVLFGPLWFLGKSVYYILFTLFDPIQSTLVVPRLFDSLQSIIV